MKARPHFSTLCGCMGCRHWDAAEVVVRMIKEGSCLGWGILKRVIEEAEAGDAAQAEVLANIKAMGEELTGATPPCK